MAIKRNEPSIEEVKARITEIVSTMPESKLEKFLIVLEKWWKSNRGKREHARKDLSIYAHFMLGSYFFRDYITNIRHQQLLAGQLQSHLLYRTMKTLSKLRGKL
ncbi:MAG: hypothetical protein JRJ41_00900 [Deltaproteobacteria bacterium]|nr:hypothetical protein [Deltaproteobacteria bacterium]